MARETEGLAHTSASPAGSRKEADASFDAARKHLLDAAALYKDAPKNPAVIQIGTEIITRQDELDREKGPKVFLERAEALAAVGMLEEATVTLTQGIERHRNSDLWLSRAKLRLISRPSAVSEILAEFQTAVSAGVVAEADPQALLFRAKGTLIAVGPHISEATAGSDTRTKLIAQVDAATRNLNEAKKAPEFAPYKSQCDAYLVQAEVFQRVLISSPSTSPPVDSKLKELYSRVKSAEDLLSAQIKEKKELLKADGKVAVTLLELREALIAAELTKGYLAVQIEGKNSYKETALVAFNKAVELIGPNRVTSREWSLLGKPLLDAIQNRPENAADKSAQAERKTRQAMGLFVEGAVALYNKEPQGASSRMKDGLETLEELNKSDVIRDTGLEDQLNGFYVLSLLAKEQKDERQFIDHQAKALMAALRAIVPELVPKKDDDEAIRGDFLGVVQRASKQATSPVVAYALAQALEQHVTSFRLDPVTTFGKDGKDTRAELLGSAKVAYERAKEMAEQGSKSAQKRSDSKAQRRWSAPPQQLERPIPQGG